METKENEFHNGELKKAFSVLESIVNKKSLEKVEEVMSEYRVFAYARENHDEKLKNKVERAFQKYSKKKRRGPVKYVEHQSYCDGSM